MNETWRKCSGGNYSVSNLGRVRRDTPGSNTRIGRIQAGVLGQRGYMIATIDDKLVPVHRLVAIAFLGPCPPRHEVNHKSGVKTDNSACNLEWVTKSENIAHAYRIGLRVPATPRGEAHGRAKLTQQAVRDIRARAARGEQQRTLAAMHGVSQAQVWRVIHGKSWRAS